MSTSVAEFLSRATQLGEFVPVLIETGTDEGTEWGVSLTSSNPEPEDYHACRNREHAISLKALLEEETT